MLGSRCDILDAECANYKHWIHQAGESAEADDGESPEATTSTITSTKPSSKTSVKGRGKQPKGKLRSAPAEVVEDGDDDVMTT